MGASVDDNPAGLPVPLQQGSTAELSTADLATRSTIPPAAVLLGVFIGSAVAFFFHVLFTAAPTTVNRPLLIEDTLKAASLPPRAGVAVASCRHEEVTPEQSSEARRALSAGRAALQNLDGRVARDAFVQCIQQADLPNCHLELGLLLLVVNDGAGYAHLERYLELAPDAHESEAIRQALQTVTSTT